MTIKDIGFCPFCGSDLFYVIEYPRGCIRRRIYADDSKDAPNHNMYDGLTFHSRKKDNYIFCDDCNKKIADGETMELTKSALKKINQMECETSGL